MKKIVLLLAALISGYSGFSQWQQTNGPLGYKVGGFAINGNEIIIGTSNGVCFSNDNGASWVQCNTSDLPAYGIYSVVVKGNNIFAASEEGVSISSDNGNSWSTINNGLTSVFVLSLAINGSNILAGTKNGVFISSNNGTSWTAAGLSNNLVQSLLVYGRYIFAATFDSGVFISSNNGSTWTHVNNGINNLYVNSLYANGNNIYASTGYSFIFQPDTLYAGVYRSIDSGATWTYLDSGLLNKTVYSVSGIGNNLVAGTDSGVYLSENNGISWAKNETFPDTLTNSIATIGNNIFAGTAKGLKVSSDEGLTWENADEGISTFIANTLLSVRNNIYAGTTMGLFVTNNFGNVWTQIGQGLSGTEILSLASSVTGDTIFAGTDDGAFFSSDSGNTWFSFGTGFTGTPVTSLAVTGNCVYVGTNMGISMISRFYGNETAAVGTNDAIAFAINGGIIYALCSGGISYAIYPSNSWTPVFDNTLQSSITSLVVSTGGDTIIGGSSEGIISSTFGGKTWKSINNGLINAEVYSLALQGHTIFAGTTAGVYFSVNWGAQWMPLNNGLPTNNIQCLLVSGDTILAGDDNQGIWKYNSFHGCSAYFALYPDSTKPHYWYAVNEAAGTPPLTYLWSWGDGNTSTGATPSHIYASAGMYNICLSITDSTGCASMYCDSANVYRTEGATMVTVNVILPGNVPTSSQQYTENDGIALYPNPTGGDVIISSSGNESIKEIQITNTIGQIVSDYSIRSGNNKNIQIQLPQPGGLYFVYVRGEQQEYVRKVVKE